MANIEINTNFSAFGCAVGLSLGLCVLRLLNLINISIWWILSPILIVIAIRCLIIFFIGLLVLIAYGDKMKENEKNKEDEGTKKTWQEILKENLENENSEDE